MSKLLERLLGRLPVGWLQLTHSRTRFAAAVAGVAFANLVGLHAAWHYGRDEHRDACAIQLP